MCHITKRYETELSLLYPRRKVQLLQFDMNDGDKREGETVGSTCAWCGGAVVILKVHGEATIQGNDSAEEDALATLANA